MRRVFSFAAMLVALLAGQASALEVKNVRLTHGLFGATRTEAKFLPGDYVFLMFDIDGLTTDTKSGKVSFEAVREILDGSKTSIYSKKLPPVELQLMQGGSRYPLKLEAPIPDDHKPGKYAVKFTVTDKVSKKTAEFTFPFEVVAEDFGIIHLSASWFGIPDTPYPIQFVLANSPLDKNKLPKMDVTMRLFEEGSKTELSKPASVNLPALLEKLDPKEKVDPKRIPLAFEVYLTRPGRFVADFEVNDKINNRKLKFQVPFIVLEMK